MKVNTLEWFALHFIMGFLIVYLGSFVMNISRLLDLSLESILTFCTIAIMIAFGLRKKLHQLLSASVERPQQQF